MFVSASLFAAGLCGASLSAEGFEPDLDSVLETEDDTFKDEMAALERGDQKEFGVVTETDVSSLEVGDIYKSNGAFFKVVVIGAKGASGGEFRVQRIAGKIDPSKKWSRVSGLGPATIMSRQSLLGWFFNGGPIMYPLAFLLLIMLIIAVNSLWVYRRKKQCPRQFVEEARAAVLAGDLDKFAGLALNEKGLFPNICRAMVNNFKTSTMDDIRARTESEAMRQISLLRTPIKGLNFIAAVAPLLGLLGTVVGMIVCFDSLSDDAASAAKSQAMADGIKIALLTTAAGLTVAVPSLFTFFVFNQKLTLLIADCEGLAAEFVQELAHLKTRTAEAEARKAAAGRPGG
ncbi:MAG: MotA/TolQ/ExbB proton channel family protein [Planctomycetota bacterium]|nr:MotA/TolQ/ExbB proton channel family protein [Planctomycetota bacterium]